MEIGADFVDQDSQQGSSQIMLDSHPCRLRHIDSRTVNSSERANTRWQERLTLLQGLLPFDKARLGPDIMAGVTLAALGIPEVMGYTKIIGTPVITGL